MPACLAATRRNMHAPLNSHQSSSGSGQGDSVCDVCKAPIRNLPAFTPRAPASEGGTEGDAFDLDDRAHPAGPLTFGEQMPGSADIVFDCIRVRCLQTAADLDRGYTVRTLCSSLIVPCMCERAARCCVDDYCLHL